MRSPEEQKRMLDLIGAWWLSPTRETFDEFKARMDKAFTKEEKNE